MELNGPPFGQPTPSTQVPTHDDKLTLLSLEFTWSAEDDPIRPMIQSGSTISSQLELSVSGIPLATCEVPILSHPAEQDSKSPEEERPQIEEEILEDKEQDDLELEQQSDQVEDLSSITLDVIEDEEPEMHLPIVI